MPWQWKARDLPYIGWLLWKLIIFFSLTPKPWEPPPDDDDEKDFRNAA